MLYHFGFSTDCLISDPDSVVLTMKRPFAVVEGAWSLDEFARNRFLQLSPSLRPVPKRLDVVTACSGS